MIICSLGYSYLSSFVFKRLCNLGIKGIGITSKKNTQIFSNNINILDWSKAKESVSFATHLLLTAPPKINGCPIFENFSNSIANSNIKSVTYVSSTGVYGNHNGAWVGEEATINAKSSFDKNRIVAEKQWKVFCKNNKLSLNIIRLSGIYGPRRITKISDTLPLVVVKKDHYFSRIHIYDAARIISKIILNSS